MAQTPVEELIDAIQRLVQVHRLCTREPTKENATAVKLAVENVVEVYEKHPAQAIADELFRRHRMPRRDN